VRGSVNAFVNRFKGLQFSRLLAQPDGTVGTIVLLGGAHAAGLEVETEIRPLPRWRLEFRSTLQNSRYHGFGDATENWVVRQPRIQFAASPSYTTSLGTARVKLHATYTYVGVRYSDVENLQRLPAYQTTDAGVHAELPSGFYADVTVQNITDAFGLTEGNTRKVGAVLTTGPIIARPLFGRNVSISVGYRF
jgi:outer membrane receptor protein involved in Fe transport